MFSIFFFLAGPACDSGGYQVSRDNPFYELAEQGITRYMGKAEVMESTTEYRVTTYTFNPESGPVCLRGELFRAAVRNTSSENLFIYLSGGGACWSSFCLALEEACEGIPNISVTDSENPENPVRDWDMVYISSCDGSLLAGDIEYDDNGDGKTDRFHHGLQNLTAALEITRENFPSPGEILLAGSSAGGIGIYAAIPLVRILYPEVPLYVLNDAGVGVLKASDPGFLSGLLEEFNASGLIPASCPGCIFNGHLTRVLEWALERDPNLTIGVFSTYEDKVFQDIFLQLAPGEFGRELAGEMDYLNGRFPERFKMFLVEGEFHTCLIDDYTVFLGSIDLGEFDLSLFVELGAMDRVALDGLTVGSWLGMMLNDDPGWTVMTER